MELKAVKRNPATGAGEAQDKNKRASDPAATISRVRLELQQRRLLRLFLLDAISPSSKYTLPRGSVLVHSDEIHSWPQSAFEGFIAACLFFLSIPRKDGHRELRRQCVRRDQHDMDGLHAKKLWGSGQEDDKELHYDPAIEAGLDAYWDSCTIQPVGDYSVLIHEYCPACEPNSYYYGWVEFCRWVTGNVAFAMGEKQDKPIEQYLEAALLLLAPGWGMIPSVTSGV